MNQEQKERMAGRLMANALRVLLLDKEIHGYLVANDMKAFLQARDALNVYEEFVGPTVLGD